MNYDVLVSHATANPMPLPECEDIRAVGIHIKKYVIPAGLMLISHCHTYDHPSILASGEVELWTSDGGLKTLSAPAETFIAAGVKHALVALEDSVWYCLHSDNGDEPLIEGEV